MVLKAVFSLVGKKVFVAGERGMVGAAIIRRLGRENCEILHAPREMLDLRNQAQTEQWMLANRPDVVFMAAAKVGGIVANNTLRADFIYDNLAIATNAIHAAHRAGVEKLMFLGSTCIYPRLAPQPMAEDSLLTGPLETTNEPYAIAKIAGVKLAEAYRDQYGADFISVMPTNLYGPGDNYHPENSHVIPALIRKFHEAKVNNAPTVTVWGTGTPKREFLYSDDMADACVYLMNLPDEQFSSLLGSDEAKTGKFMPPLVNIGFGEDMSIRELAVMVKEVVGFTGQIAFDPSKPDGTPRKLLDVSRLRAIGWGPRMPLRAGLEKVYGECRI